MVFLETLIILGNMDSVLVVFMVSKETIKSNQYGFGEEQIFLLNGKIISHTILIYLQN
jgi:hypothetical protein